MAPLYGVNHIRSKVSPVWTPRKCAKAHDFWIDLKIFQKKIRKMPPRGLYHNELECRLVFKRREKQRHMLKKKAAARSEEQG